MWKQLWKKWTLDKPAAFGDLLWEVFVVQLAAFLDRLTLRQIIAFIPVLILVLAYAHSIPIPPELMLIGDVLAYIDIYSAIFLLGIMSRAATILFTLKQTAAHAAQTCEQPACGLATAGFPTSPRRWCETSKGRCQPNQERGRRTRRHSRHRLGLTALS